MGIAEGFREVPGWDGYFVNAKGCVRSRFGEIEIDARGRASLYNAQTRKRRSIPVAELLRLAGFQEVASLRKLEAAVELADNCKLEAALEEARAEIATLRLEIEKAARLARYQRKLNATLWSRLRRLIVDTQGASRKEVKKRVECEEADWNDLTLGMAADFGADFAEAWDE